MNRVRNITKFLTWFTGIVILVMVVAVPAGYYALSYQYMAGSIDSEAELNARVISYIISDNPDMWQFEQVRLRDYLSRRSKHEFQEIRRIWTSNGILVASSEDVVDTPSLSRSVKLYDAGMLIGRLEVTRSLRPILSRTVVLASIVMVLGIGIFIVLRNVPIRAIQRGELALFKERDTAQRYLDIVEVMLVALDARKRVILVNRKGCEVLGYEEKDILNKNWFETFLPSDQRESAEELFVQMIQGARSEHGYFENALLTRNGKKRFIAWNMIVLTDEAGAITGTLSSGEDITDRKHLEDQLRHAQKMEAVGLLAGGIAHDFNNILAAIIGYASLIQMKMTSEDPLVHNVEQILNASGRAARLVKSLLAFSRKQIIDPRPIPVNRIVTEVEKLLARLLREDIEMRIHLSDEDLTVNADLGQIEQVLMNLATNARDAMPNGGLFSIRTDRVVWDHDYVAAHGFGAIGAYARIVVTDTGVGMSAAIQQKMFDPFFTTKDVGKGTGLGLAMSYGIIKQHNGFINVYSEEGKGTTFNIYLPLTTSVASLLTDKGQVPLSRGSETILLAEDDAVVRDMMILVLRNAGYRVIEARDGEEAFELFKQHIDAIQVAILDVIMPKLNGMELYNEIRKLRPAMKVLFTSGYTAEIIQDRMLLTPGMHFVSKPAAPKDLLAKVREVIDAPSGKAVRP